MNENKKTEDEKVTVRHTINAEETFTLAKDVFDIRCFVKNVYNNRAVIARRLNALTLTAGLIYTLLYVAYIIFTGLIKKLGLGAEISLFCLLGVYAVMFTVLSVLTFCGKGVKTKNVHKINKTLSVMRFIVRALSVAMTIVALVMSMNGGYAAKYVAVDIILIIFSIVCLIIQAIPLICGGIGKIIRWLLSPVKVRHRFSAVALEWYELTVTSRGEVKNKKRVADRYFEDIGRCLDNFLIPVLGKKYISSIKPVTVLNTVERAPQDDRNLTEGILKSIFDYAAECGYVTFNPCRDLNFEGSIEEEEKPKSGGIKNKLFGIGKKLGKSILDKYIDKNSSED